MEIRANQSDGIFPKFFEKAVENKGKSLEEGRPVFESQEYVEIHIAGDRNNVVCRKVTENDRQRWAPIYEAFKKGLVAPLEGTPINEWPALTSTRVAELKALHILTVEALAQLPDAGIARIGMDGRKLVAAAKAFLETSKDAAAAQKYAVENQQLRDDINMLKDQIKELSALIDKQKAAKQEIAA